MANTKREIIQQLQQEILLLQGFKPPATTDLTVGLGQIESTFPNSVFPTGSMHEFLCEGSELAAAAGGFIAGILNRLMAKGAACMWISTAAAPFPPALKFFGLDPARVVFARFKHERDVLWAVEEALKCEGLAAVVGEIRDISLTMSRRLQLVVEQSRVTSFLLRHHPRDLNPIAVAARWKITPLASALDDGMPGVGYPRWTVELLRVRNGKPGTWQIGWDDNGFVPVTENVEEQSTESVRKIG